MVAGVLWDISWHSAIGRDTFWSPPHMAMYLGGVVAGAVCGWLVLRITLAGSEAERAGSVSWWGYFRGPLGAWTCIWGAIAMLTSAPFDDWWHNAYGLDVKILSPPHAVLAAGILAIQVGAVFMALARQNRDAEADPLGAQRHGRAVRWLTAYSLGLVLLNFAIMATDYTWRIFQHGGLFYQVVSAIFLIPLVAGAVASRLRWAATAVAGTYMLFLLVLIWIFPLFPAEPRLAPVLNPIDRMVPPQFPLLLVVPALAIDLLMHRWEGRKRGWGLATLISAVFLLAFVPVQWPFAIFLNSEWARNPLFGQHILPYMVGPDWYISRGEFLNPDGAAALAAALAIAFALGVLASRVGLSAGGWMARLRR